MGIRSRVALLIAATVLVASVIGGVGAVISSRNVAENRVDRALQESASAFPISNTAIEGQLRVAFAAQRASCDDAEAVAADEEPPTTGRPTTGRAGDSRRGRFLAQFASALQLITAEGSTFAGCQALPVDDADFAIAREGAGQRFRTVTVDGERYRVYTEGVPGVGAMQYGQTLAVTEDAVSGLLGRTMFFGLLGAILAGLFGWVFAGRLTEPLRRLSATAERVAQTRDLGERIDLEAGDEIGALTTSFNTMLTSLDTSREQQHRLVQDASHELRTPLTSIRTNLELLQRHPDIDAETRAEILGDMSLELGELTELTGELVESATEIPTELRATGPVDLTAVANECVERARRRHHRSIEVVLHPSSMPASEANVVVLGDPVLLARAITNLVNNAVKFSPETSDIQVEVSDSALTVLDRGPGIEPADLPKIFDRFYRATAARSAPGSGLGLSIVKQIVEGHQGSVSAQNRAAGGASIGFTLPTTPG